MPKDASKQKDDPKPFKTTIIWGEHVNHKETYEFATQAELDAFLQGVFEADGWMDYKVVNDD